MSTNLSPRPLSVIPFIAVDAVLLLTAGLIGWVTPGELTGGPLLAVVSCVGLGAVAMVYPFIVNDVHQREAALAERQRELAELVTASNAHASRWGTQWAAAATGLQDAADLATRSLAAAERLPVMFEQTADALVQKLTETEQQAQSRVERAAQQESALAAQLGAQFAAQLDQQAAQLANQISQTGAQDSALAARDSALANQVMALSIQLAPLTGQLASLTEQVAQISTQESALAARETAFASQLDAFASQFSALSAQVLPIGTAAAEFKTTLQEFSLIEASVREQSAAITATLAKFPVAAEQARTARSELQNALTAAPAQLAAEVEQRVSAAELRIGATTAALTARLAEVETAVNGLIAQLNRVAEVAVAATAAAATSAATPVAITASEALDALVYELTPKVDVKQAPETVTAEVPLSFDPPKPVKLTSTVEEVSGTPVTPPVAAVGKMSATAPGGPGAPTALAKTPVHSDLIMDPFIIPTNGYAALADAMDMGDA